MIENIFCYSKSIIFFLEGIQESECHSLVASTIIQNPSLLYTTKMKNCKALFNKY